jgi:hypothetical protein
VVTALVAGSPPAVTVQIGGDTSTDVDLPYLSSYIPVIGDTVTLLSVGPDHYVLGSDTVDATWIGARATFYAMMRQTTTQSIPNAGAGSFTNITWSGTADVSQGMTVTTAGIVIPVAGVYNITGLFCLPATAGQHSAILLKNGVGINGSKVTAGFNGVGGSGPADVLCPMIPVLCAAADVISVAGQQSSGGAVNTVVATNEYSMVHVAAV